MDYKKTYVPKSGYTPICKIGESSLKMLEFGMVELWAGEQCTLNTDGNETAFILLGAAARGAGCALAAADIVVAGGMGVGGKEGFARLAKLAGRIGAGLAATRAAVNAGWAPYCLSLIHI